MSTYVAVFALVLAYVAFVVGWLALRALHRLRGSLAGGGRVSRSARRDTELPASIAAQLQDLRAHVDATTAEAFARIEASRPDPASALCNVALVRYDAFGEMSGRMSFSLALLDNNGDGITITALAGTSNTSVYAKGIRNGEGEHDLSPEERQAVSTALHRPRGLLGRRAS